MSWTQKGSDIDGEAAGDISGSSVSLSDDGTVLAIGAPFNDGTGSNRAGHVRVYAWNDSAWVQRGSDIDGEADVDWSGYSVSLSDDGSVIAIGAVYNDGTGSMAGHVRIFEWNSGTSSWDQKGADIDGEAAFDRSGWSVSLSEDGSVVAIGAYENDDAGSQAGHVRVYDWDGDLSSWMQRGDDIDGEATGDRSGWSVSLNDDGGVVAIGANTNDGTGSDAGHVRIFEWNSGTSSWGQKGADIDGEAAGDESGYSVSLSDDGTVLAVGAPFNDGTGSDAGHVRIFEWNSGTSSWDQKGADIDGEAATDYSGYSVSLSEDGGVVAIGASGNDGAGSAAGHVRIYAWNGSAWAQRGSDIDGEAAADQSGKRISLSADATTVAVGAPYNDGTGDAAGHVRVYEWSVAASSDETTSHCSVSVSVSL
jgi:hypothetical protein